MNMYRVAFVLICMNLESYIEKITRLRNPQTGKMCIVLYDDHWKLSKEENNEQAHLMVDVVIPDLYKSMLKTGKKLGVFYESVRFYEKSNKSQKLSCLDLKDSVIYKKNGKQTTWISWLFPYLFYNKSFSNSDNIVFKSIDPRDVIVYHRAKLNNQNPLVKKRSLLDIDSMLDDVKMKLFDLQINPEDLEMLLGVIKPIITKLNEERSKFDQELKQIFVQCSLYLKEYNLKNPIHKVTSEHFLDEYKKFFAEIFKDHYISCLRRFIYNPEFLSDLLDLNTLIEIYSNSSDFSLIIVGDYHANNIVKYLKEMKYIELELSEYQKYLSINEQLINLPNYIRSSVIL